MDLQARIEKLAETRLVGNRLNMSFARNRTPELWRQFMPRRGQIQHVTGPELYSVELYPDPEFFRVFDPNRPFEKWAAAPVSDPSELPEGMEVLVLPAGLYAVFSYKGKAREAAPFYQAIFQQWLPGSDYSLDHRPHFAKMGEKYQNDDPESEEEIWIPVKKRDDPSG